MRRMKRYSKPLGNLLDFKQDFFHSNDQKLREFVDIATVYTAQPRRADCKNCAAPIVFTPSNTFKKLGVDYAFCPRCGHCNGAHEDTQAFCNAMYTDDQGKKYSENYTEADEKRYKQRVAEIYEPKAAFLKDALAADGAFPASLSDFGAGAGYFVAAARGAGFTGVKGYEPSQVMAAQGNAMLGPGSLVNLALEDTAGIVARSDSSVLSFIGVLEHLQNPRDILAAASRNPKVRYLYLSLPLFSPSVVFETVFPAIMPRHLVAGHTHLYTEESIAFLCKEFGFTVSAEWWFGLDMTDLYRSILVSLQKTGGAQQPLLDYLTKRFLPAVDAMQAVLDERRICSEVHVVLKRR